MGVLDSVTTLSGRLETLRCFGSRPWGERRWGLHHMVLSREAWDRNRERFAGIVNVQRQYHEMTQQQGERQ